MSVLHRPLAALLRDVVGAQLVKVDHGRVLQLLHERLRLPRVVLALQPAGRWPDLRNGPNWPRRAYEPRIVRQRITSAAFFLRTLAST